MFLIEHVISKLRLHTLLVRLPKLLDSVAVRADLLAIVVDHVDVGISLAVGLVQLLALVAARWEEAAEFG